MNGPGDEDTLQFCECGRKCYVLVVVQKLKVVNQQTCKSLPKPKSFFQKTHFFNLDFVTMA